MAPRPRFVFTWPSVPRRKLCWTLCRVRGGPGWGRSSPTRPRQPTAHFPFSKRTLREKKCSCRRLRKWESELYFPHRKTNIDLFDRHQRLDSSSNLGSWRSLKRSISFCGLFLLLAFSFSIFAQLKRKERKENWAYEKKRGAKRRKREGKTGKRRDILGS